MAGGIMASSRKSTPAGRKSRTSTPRKSSPAPAPAATRAPAPAAAEAASHLAAVPPARAPETSAITSGGAPDAEDTRFKRPDLIEAVSQRTALKRSDAKVVLELVLDELGKALDGRDELVLPPLGKLMVKKRKPDADGPDILTLKLRRPRDAGDGAGESPLAEPGEDG
jgi:hypothetical protein